jgi:methylphosphotriester-DNA--protein-cysteine methyltransferase
MHLQPEQQAAIASKLLKKMQDDKMYTDPDLTLEKLAKALSIPRHHVSETLNQYLKKSFYQCVNEFRVEEVIRLLSKCKQQGINPGILSMAYEAGFQSKTTFNQYFKKRTGITPSEYLQKEDADRMQQAIAHTPNRMGNNRLTVT